MGVRCVRVRGTMAYKALEPVLWPPARRAYLGVLESRIWPSGAGGNETLRGTAHCIGKSPPFSVPPGLGSYQIPIRRKMRPQPPPGPDLR